MDIIVDYYTKFDEKNRLTRHSLEKIRTQEIISRYLSKDKMKILDVGGAAGVYSFWLSSLGHIVDLMDMVPKHIDQCREIEKSSGVKLNSLLTGDARNLPYDDQTYDMVLLMGPLYHLTAKEDRIQALKESLRVLKHGGVLIAAVISRYAALFDGFRHNLVADKEFQKILDGSINNGNHINNTGNPNYFTSAYFHMPEELKEELLESGFAFESLVAVEGFGNLFSDLEERIKDESYLEMTLEYIRKTENEPSIMGVSNHFIGIGMKKG
jgi:ubiquinone/menaquinone biosynthesis C-methylase UbiE